MAKASALSFISFTLTQGSADAFAQTTVATALSGQTRSAYQLRELVLEFSGTQGIVQASLDEWSIAMTRKSFAAMPTVLEKALISKWKRASALTTTGSTVGDTVIRLTWGETDGPLIVEDPIYAQIDSTNTSATNVVYGRFGYTVVTLSEVDRLTLIANSLS